MDNINLVMWRNDGAELSTDNGAMTAIAVCAGNKLLGLDGNATAILVRTAVNGCKAVNMRDPLAVARKIPLLAAVLGDLMKGIGDGCECLDDEKKGHCVYCIARDVLKKIGA